jgi:hypothetical protein
MRPFLASASSASTGLFGQRASSHSLGLMDGLAVDVVELTYGPVVDLVGLPSIEGLASASAGLWCNRVWPLVGLPTCAMVCTLLGSNPWGLPRVRANLWKAPMKSKESKSDI